MSRLRQGSRTHRRGERVAGAAPGGDTAVAARAGGDCRSAGGVAADPVHTGRGRSGAAIPAEPAMRPAGRVAHALVPLVGVCWLLPVVGLLLASLRGGDLAPRLVVVRAGPVHGRQLRRRPRRQFARIRHRHDGRRLAVGNGCGVGVIRDGGVRTAVDLVPWSPDRPDDHWRVDARPRAGRTSADLETVRSIGIYGEVPGLVLVVWNDLLTAIVRRSRLRTTRHRAELTTTPAGQQHRQRGRGVGRGHGRTMAGMSRGMR